jgi:ABC-2 type transport system permease protein
MIYIFKLNLNYLTNEILTSLNRTLILLSSLIIFTYIQKENSEIITYLILGNVFFATTEPSVSWFLSNGIQDGKLVRLLLLPQNIFTYIFFNGLSGAIYMSFGYMFSLLPIILIFHNQINFSFNFFYLLFFWPIVVIIRLMFDILAGLVAFWTVESYGAVFLNMTFIAFFSGSMFPLIFILDKFPFLNFTPWSIILHHPMQIYLNKYSPLETLFVFLGGLAWCFVLYFLAKIVFKMGLKRNEAVGL